MKSPILTKLAKMFTESNSVLGQTQLGNDILRSPGSSPNSFNTFSIQQLYPTISAVNDAGRAIDVTYVTRNSTVMSCVELKARSLAQLPLRVMCEDAEGRKVNALTSPGVSARERNRARSVTSLLRNPNEFQTAYEFWYQYVMWYELFGEAFALWYRPKGAENDPTKLPIEMYVLDSSLIAVNVNSTRYPTYRMSTPVERFSLGKGQELAYYQIMHATEVNFHGSSGFSKYLQAVELISLDHDLDVLANYVMANSSKITGIFSTEAVIPDGKLKELTSRIKEQSAKVFNSDSTQRSKPGETLVLDSGATFKTIDMPNLQTADVYNLKRFTTARICALAGVPPTDVRYH